MKGLCLVAALSAAVLAGCASKPFGLSVPYDEKQGAEMAAPGKNTIIGSGLLRQRGGGVVTCAGHAVSLVPLTAYAREWASYEFEWTGPPDASGFGMRYAGSRGYAYLHPAGFTRHIRETRCDAQGNFKFDEVADGTFYAVTNVSWVVGYSPQGGLITRIVRIGGAKRHDVVITN